MTTMIHVKVDEKVKNDAKKVASDLGLSLSAMITASLKQIIQNKTVTFSTEEILRPEVEEMIRQAGEDYKNGVNISKPITSIQDIEDYFAAL